MNICAARWAEKGEVKAAGLLGADGVVLGKLDRDYLRHDGPLRFGVQKFLAQFLLAFRIRKNKTVGRGEFGEHHVGLTVRGDEPPERRIRHVLKRRKRKKGLP